MIWQVGALRKEVEQIDKQVAEAQRLLRLADPDGYFREGTRAAEAAKAKGIKAMEVEKKRREAEERQRRERLVHAQPLSAQPVGQPPLSMSGLQARLCMLL